MKSHTINTPSDSIVAQIAPSREQRPAVIARASEVAVVAGAGSGKTRTLVARYLRLVSEGLSPRHIVAITFTDKAAREMRSRVRAEITRYLERDDLDDNARGTWQQRYETLDSARISTIHSLCAEILRQHPAEAKVDPRFEVLTDASAGRLLADALDSTLAWAVEQEALVSLLVAFPPDRLRSVLESALHNRLDAAQAFSLADEGLLAHWQGCSLHEVVSRLKSEDLVDALGALRDLEANGTLAHALGRGDKCAAIVESVLYLHADLQDLVAEVGRSGAADPATMLELLGAIAATIKLNVGSKRNWGCNVPKAELRAIREGIRAAFGKAIDPDRTSAALDAPAAELTMLLAGVAAGLFTRYAQTKDGRNALDFDDLEERALELLSDPLHASVLERWRNQVSAILVDEFQDTNGRQRDLIRLLAGDGLDGGLFIVGDGKQSIYRFRGADVSVFARERQAIDAVGECHTLSTSYRAHAQLVLGLNAIMSRVLDPTPDPDRPFAEPFSPLVPGRDEPATGLKPPYIEAHLCIGSKASGAMAQTAGAIADQLARMVEDGAIRFGQDDGERPVNYGDIAILCRRSGSFRYYEDALDEAGIPYVTVAGRGFYERPEIRDLLNLMTALADSGDDLALAGALRSPGFAVSDLGLYALCAARDARKREQGVSQTLWTLLERLAGLDGDVEADWPGLNALDHERMRRACRVISGLRRLVGRVTVAELLKRLLDETRYRAILVRSGQSRALRNVDKLLSDAHNSGLVGVGEFLEYVQFLRDSGAREGEAATVSEGAVQIMSIHAAKGLEFPIVVIGDMGSAGSHRTPDLLLDDAYGPALRYSDGDDRLPLSYQMAAIRDAERDAEEDKRLLYVAATRARERLLLSGNVTTKKGGALGGQAGWLKALAGPELLDLVDKTPEFGEGADKPTAWQRSIDGVLATCWLYPEAYSPTRRMAAFRPEPRDDSVRPPLLSPLTAGAEEGGARERLPVEAASPKPIPRIVYAPGGYPAWLRGQIVHDALAQWRFSDPEIDEWIDARAALQGLDTEACARLRSEVRRLLNRFEESEMCAEMMQAEQRFAEVPYAWEGDSGRIDALYVDTEGRWHVVEFKTDRLRSDTTLAQLLAESDYESQIGRYREAVAGLLGQTPNVQMVLLDFHGGLHVEDLTARYDAEGEEKA